MSDTRPACGSFALCPVHGTYHPPAWVQEIEAERVEWKAVAEELAEALLAVGGHTDGAGEMAKAAYLRFKAVAGSGPGGNPEEKETA